jgi:hypothetical protein
LVVIDESKSRSAHRVRHQYYDPTYTRSTSEQDRTQSLVVLFRQKTRDDAVRRADLCLRNERSRRRSTWVSGEKVVNVSGDKLSYCTPRPFAVAVTSSQRDGPIVEHQGDTKDPFCSAVCRCKDGQDSLAEGSWKHEWKEGTMNGTCSEIEMVSDVYPGRKRESAHRRTHTRRWNCGILLGIR